MNHLVAFVGHLSHALETLAAWVLLPVMSAIVLIDVLMRYAFNAPLIWSLEATEYLLLMVFVLALPECSRRDGHVHVDMIVRLMPGGLRRATALLTPVLFLGIVYLLYAHAWDEFLFNFDRGRGTQYLRLPIWVEYFALLAAGALIALIYGLRIVATLLGRDAVPGADARDGEG